MMHRAMKLISVDDRLSFEVHAVREHERPPIVTVPGYRRKRGLAASGGFPGSG